MTQLMSHIYDVILQSSYVPCASVPIESALVTVQIVDSGASWPFSSVSTSEFWAEMVFFSIITGSRIITWWINHVTDITWFLRGGIYYKTEVKWRRSITCIDMHEKSKIKHSISLRKYLRVFANSIIKYINCSEILL